MLPVEHEFFDDRRAPHNLSVDVCECRVSDADLQRIVLHLYELDRPQVKPAEVDCIEPARVNDFVGTGSDSYAEQVVAGAADK